MIVLEDGNSLIYDIHGKLVRNFLLLDAVTTVHVLECHFWGNGVVAISSDMQLFVAEVCYFIKECHVMCHCDITCCSTYDEYFCPNRGCRVQKVTLGLENTL